MPPPPPQPGDHISAVNEEAASTQPRREVPCNVFRAQAFQPPAPGGVGGGCGPALHTGRAGRARALALLAPHPTSRGFGLWHTNSPCGSAASLIRLPQLRRRGGARGMPPHPTPGQGPSSKPGSRDFGFSFLGLRERGLKSTLNKTESSLMNVTRGCWASRRGDVWKSAGGTEVWQSPRNDHTWVLPAESHRQGPASMLAAPSRPCPARREVRAPSQTKAACSVPRPGSRGRRPRVPGRLQLQKDHPAVLARMRESAGLRVSP